ncbi:c-type cytochrome [Parasphingorhabdus sp.]|uniref:c-type cytochrome n=1 Tax=Parasphingorhabdus sp. TaxID=2709688 RepID=UPI0032673780
MAIASKLVNTIAACAMLAACGSPQENPSDTGSNKETASKMPKAVPGKTLFMQCAACHSLDADGPKKTGPNLHNVVGRKAGSVEGYRYSKALGAADFAWTREKLDEFITKPFATVPGTIMAFSGIADSEKRKQLIDYIESTDSPAAD